MGERDVEPERSVTRLEERKWMGMRRGRARAVRKRVDWRLGMRKEECC